MERRRDRSPTHGRRRLRVRRGWFGGASPIVRRYGPHRRGKRGALSWQTRPTVPRNAASRSHRRPRSLEPTTGIVVRISPRRSARRLRSSCTTAAVALRNDAGRLARRWRLHSTTMGFVAWRACAQERHARTQECWACACLGNALRRTRTAACSSTGPRGRDPRRARPIGISFGRATLWNALRSVIYPPSSASFLASRIAASSSLIGACAADAVPSPAPGVAAGARPIHRNTAAAIASKPTAP